MLGPSLIKLQNGFTLAFDVLDYNEMCPFKHGRKFDQSLSLIKGCVIQKW